MDNMHGAGKQATPNLPKSQAIKDATMAHFIIAYFKKAPPLYITMVPIIPTTRRA
jgi:hypothetical protein